MFRPLLFLAAIARADGQPPVAEAGLGVMAYVGDTVVLNGSASADPEGAPLTWDWSQTSGPPVELKKADTEKPSFKVTAPGTVRFQLVVSDGTLVSEPDSVAVVVPDPSALPLGEEPGACAHAPGAPVGAAVLALLCLAARRRG